MNVPVIFKSKRFWSAVIGLIAMIITGLVPELKEHIDIMIPAIVGIIGLLIGGYSIEDAITARSSALIFPPVKDKNALN